MNKELKECLEKIGENSISIFVNDQKRMTFSSVINPSNDVD
jgi:hypothetical protein